jgi:hypothetical protein
MRRAASILMTLLALVGCTEELSKEENDLVDALIFALEGFEENTQPKYNLQPWKRMVTGRTVEFSTIRNNAIFSSDDAFNAKTRPSKFIRLSEMVTPLENAFSRNYRRKIGPRVQATRNLAPIPPRLS